MSNGDRRDPHQRGSTDESLRAERDKTDAMMNSRAESSRNEAEDLVTRARKEADTILNDARELEDQTLLSSSAREVSHERARADAAMDAERARADATLVAERRRRGVALASLLAFEREHTDLRLETEREHADLALTTREDFMAMVSHDLRGLLGGIALSAELLKQVGDKPGASTQVKQYAATIQRFTARMSRLVGDLMDLASIDAGRLSVVRVGHDVTLLLEDAIEAFRPAALAHGIELDCEPLAELGIVELDPERILQVLTNLVGNALKFTPKGGRITLRVHRRTDAIHFEVSDTGEGIAADKLEKVFERYFQSGGVDRRGLGLGLFIAKSIIDQHDGRIWAESAPGAGCTFFFTVPVGANAVARPNLS